jgi:phosphomannomutase / phosphoglucomutase
MKTSLPAGLKPVHMLLAVGLLVAVVLAALLTFFLPDGNGEEASAAERQAALAQAQLLIAEPRRSLEELRGQLTRVAATEELRLAIAEGSPETREALAERLCEELQHCLVLRLLAVGHSELDTRRSPALTYAALKLLRDAETTGEPPVAEMLAAGTPDAHLLMIERVTDAEGKLIGFLQAAWDDALLESWLTGFAALPGYKEVRQLVVGAPPLVVLRQGGESAPNAPPTLIGIPGGRFSLALWPGSAPRQAAGGGTGDSGLTLVLGLAGLVVLAVAGALAWARRGGAASGARASSSVVFDGAVRAVLSGRHHGLERLLPALPPGVKVAPPEEAPRARGAKAAAGDAASDAPAATAIHATPQENGIEVFDPAEETASSVVQKVSDHLTESAVMIDFGAFESATQEFDLDLTGGSEASADAAPEEVERAPRSLFRAYDIRGIAGEELTEDVAYAVGRALGSEAEARGQGSVVVARDGRVSSPELAEAVIQGLIDTGREVIDIGLAPTPVLYFATHYLDARTGIMVTGSHNPAQWNGFKLVLDGETLSGEAVEGLRQRINRGEYCQGNGKRVQANMLSEYIRRVSEDIPVALTRPFNIVVDAGNSVAGLVAPPLLRALGHDVVELNCEVDGTFPNHDPDPSQAENLLDLQGRVMAEDADFGLAFDGDGDRLGFVAENGEIIWADRLLMLLAADVLSRRPGAPVLYDVKCSRALERVVTQAGGRPVMTRTGHSFIRAQMKEMDAPLGGELSGHIFVGERWYGFDDALYAAARLIEILMSRSEPASEVFASLQTGHATPELRMPMEAERARAVMEQVLARAGELGGEPITLDGLRVNYPDAWGLLRASTTMAGLVARFEGDTPESLAQVQVRFATLLASIDPTLELPTG